MNTQLNDQNWSPKKPKINNDGTVNKSLVNSVMLEMLHQQLEKEKVQILSEALKNSFTSTKKAQDVYITKGFYGANVNMGTYAHPDLDREILPQLAGLLNVKVDSLSNPDAYVVTANLGRKNAKYINFDTYWNNSKNNKFLDRALVMLGNMPVEVITKWNGKEFEHTIFMGMRVVLSDDNKQIKVKFQTHIKGYRSNDNKYPMYALININDVDPTKVIDEIFSDKQVLLNDLVNWNPETFYEW